MKDMDQKELELIVRDKYHGDTALLTQDDRDRLAAGEPLAYIIGWVPFLGLEIHLDSHPLIPRPETEWWTGQLLTHLKKRFGDKPFSFLDLCAGSGCIGLAVMQAFTHAHVTFAELSAEHGALIETNITRNGLDPARASIYIGDLFSSVPKHTPFDCIASNPPYIPEDRILEPSVSQFEPTEALMSGPDGLTLIRRIASQCSSYLTSHGEVWIECDIANVAATAALFEESGFRTKQCADQYGRRRLVLAYV